MSIETHPSHSITIHVSSISLHVRSEPYIRSNHQPAFPRLLPMLKAFSALFLLYFIPP